MAINVGYIIGSVAAASINRKLVHGLVRLEAERGGDDAMHFTEIPIAPLSIYDYGQDANYPPEAVELKRAIRASEGLLIATPEYNRSIPGALKNAIDWASRPYGDSAFLGKPVGIIGASVGAIGTAMAQQHLRNILAYLDAPTLGQPEAFLHFTKRRFAEDGTVVDDDTREFLTGWLDALRGWIVRHAR